MFDVKKQRTSKEESEFKKLHRKVLSGKATRQQVLRAIDLKRKSKFDPKG